MGERDDIIKQPQARLTPQPGVLAPAGAVEAAQCRAAQCRAAQCEAAPELAATGSQSAAPRARLAPAAPLGVPVAPLGVPIAPLGEPGSAAPGSSPPLEQTPSPRAETAMSPREHEVAALGVGTLVAERYRIVGRLGSGAMGTVFHAVNERVGRAYALKVVTGTATTGESASLQRQRLLREALASGSSDHPNVVTVYDVVFLGAEPCLVMELLHGCTLREALRGRAMRPVEPRAAVRLLLPVIDAVSRFHARGVVHRDLKPSNLFLVHPAPDARTSPGNHAAALDDPRCFLKILDFGVAALRASSIEGHHLGQTLTEAGAIVGTPLYMAPEQLHGHTVSGQADVYALGVVLFEMLTGELPCQASNLPALAVALAGQQADELRSRLRNHLVPDSLARVAVQALSVPTRDRFADAPALHAALQRCQQTLEASDSGRGGDLLAPAEALRKGSHAEPRESTVPNAGRPPPAEQRALGRNWRGRALWSAAVVATSGGAVGLYLKGETRQSETLPSTPSTVRQARPDERVAAQQRSSLTAEATELPAEEDHAPEPEPLAAPVEPTTETKGRTPNGQGQDSTPKQSPSTQRAPEPAPAPAATTRATASPARKATQILGAGDGTSKK